MNFVGSFHEDGWVVARDMARGGANATRARRRAAISAAAFNHARMLADAGRVDEALRVARRAAARPRPPAFAAKARTGCAAAAGVRRAGSAALLGGVR